MDKIPDNVKCPYCSQDTLIRAMGLNWEPRWMKCQYCGNKIWADYDYTVRDFRWVTYEPKDDRGNYSWYFSGR